MASWLLGVAEGLQGRRGRRRWPMDVRRTVPECCVECPTQSAEYGATKHDSLYAPASDTSTQRRRMGDHPTYSLDLPQSECLDSWICIPCFPADMTTLTSTGTTKYRWNGMRAKRRGRPTMSSGREKERATWMISGCAAVHVSTVSITPKPEDVAVPRPAVGLCRTACLVSELALRDVGDRPCRWIPSRWGASARAGLEEQGGSTSSLPLDSTKRIADHSSLDCQSHSPHRMCDMPS